MNSRASVEMSGKVASGKLTRSELDVYVTGSKGIVPLSRMYAMTPTDQTSTATSYAAPRCSCSGAA